MKLHKGHIYLMLAFSLAGTSVVTGRSLTKALDSFAITIAGLSLMLLCLFPFFAAKTLHTIRRLQKPDWAALFCQALFGIFLFRILLLTGLPLTSTAEAGILTGAAPAITALLAWFFLREPLSAKTVLGIFCTVTGIILLQNHHLTNAARVWQHLTGNLFVLGAAACESVFNVISRKQRRIDESAQLPFHPLVQTMLVAVAAGMLCLIPALWENSLEALWSIGWQEWGALLWYGLVITALSFVCFYEGVKYCDAYTTAALSGLLPLTALLLAVLFLGEAMTYQQWLGSLLVVCSILLLAGQKKISTTGGDFT